MGDTRVEHDLLGERAVPAEALYGIYTVRALENFPLARRAVHPALVHAYGAVKLACARTNRMLYVRTPDASPGPGSAMTRCPGSGGRNSIQKVPSDPW